MQIVLYTALLIVKLLHISFLEFNESHHKCIEFTIFSVYCFFGVFTIIFHMTTRKQKLQNYILSSRCFKVSSKN